MPISLTAPQARRVAHARTLLQSVGHACSTLRLEAPVRAGQALSGAQPQGAVLDTSQATEHASSERRAVRTREIWPGDLGELLGRLVQDFEAPEDASTDARREAERSRDFHDGNQWTAEEIAIPRKRRQPVVWNNIIGRKVELLRGLERRGRSDPEAFPRNPVDGVRADAATQALRHVADENRFDVIRSAAYDNMLVEGFGGCEVIVEMQEDGAGYDVVINHIPWSRLYYDPHLLRSAFAAPGLHRRHLPGRRDLDGPGNRDGHVSGLRGHTVHDAR